MLLLESVSKKLNKYVEVSLFIKWYKENKVKIAEIIGVDVNKLPEIKDMLSISRELIKDIINPQSRGDSGNDFRRGFDAFVKLEYILIHDFLHNLYNVNEKDFSKSLANYEYSVSEIVEEIECLAIEESYMKWFNLKVASEERIAQYKKR